MMRFGKCTLRKLLTKKLNMPGWIIYRDSEYGMYAYHQQLGLDTDLGYWNITLKDPNLDKTLSYIRNTLLAREKGCEGVNCVG